MRRTPQNSFESTVTADMVDLYTHSYPWSVREEDIGSGVRQWTGQQILHKTRIPGEAMDGSPALCLASEFVAEVFCAQIEEMDYQQEFDGIWA